jgi:hypothetical protein
MNPMSWVKLAVKVGIGIAKVVRALKSNDAPIPSIPRRKAASQALIDLAKKARRK